MEINIIIELLSIILMALLGYYVGSRGKNEQINDLKTLYEQQIAELKASFERQLQQMRETHDNQIASLKQMNKEQLNSQLDLIKEQMQTTSEKVLKSRQNELGEQNKEQVSKIIDPLQKSLKDMQQALENTKRQQEEALTRLDQTIQDNMKNSEAIGETADRLSRALTGEVKVQGNFGELKLRQLLEDLELKEGEQFDTQETLKDKYGKKMKGDDEKGLVPDFILHFPNNRHVVVDSKMSLTDYERYMNAEEGDPLKSDYLKAHINSVRSQVKRLARKEYTKYLPDGYNRLNFAIMYIPIEGALNLALLNDTTLWREAYDEGVMVLGPQTMYMNLRVLEMMWTQIRQLQNQEAMMKAANMVIDRVQDFGLRFASVEKNMTDTVNAMQSLKISTAEEGRSIITAARTLLKAGASENKKKKSLAEMDKTVFLEDDPTPLISDTDNNSTGAEQKDYKSYITGILPFVFIALLSCSCHNSKTNQANDSDLKTEIQDSQSANPSVDKITAEMAYQGVSNYCHKEYDWSVAKDNPDMMYVKMGEETDTAYQVVFRSYTGAFVYFYVDKASGTTKMVEKVPDLGIEEESGTINLFDYIDNP